MACIATMTLARDAGEAGLIAESLETLSASGHRIFVADGGSPAAFLERIDRLPGLTRVAPAARGLVPQVKAAMRAARDSGADRVLYTEPDKLDFFRSHLGRILAATEQAPGNLVVIARTQAAFETFPLTQRFTESTINVLESEATG